MAKFWKVIIVLAIIAAALIALTYFVPDIKSLAVTMKGTSNVPLWIVGLAAPLVYGFKKITAGLGSLFTGSTESAISTENESIKKEIAALRDDVRRNDEWRQMAMASQLREITLLQQHLQILESQDATLAAKQTAIEQRTPEQAFHEEGNAPLETRGISRDEGVVIN